MKLKQKIKLCDKDKNHIYLHPNHEEFRIYLAKLSLIWLKSINQSINQYNQKRQRLFDNIYGQHKSTHLLRKA